MIRPLAGATVIEVVSDECPTALRLAASLAARVAADLGARVIKLEPPGGDPIRRLPPFCGDHSAVFAFLNAGKKSVATGPIAAHNRHLARLLERADAVILDDGLDRALALPVGAPPVRSVLSLLAPHVADAPPHTEFTLMALGGLLDIVGEPDREPLRLGGHQLAYAAGLAAYGGLVAGLLRKPAPEVARISMLDVAVWLNWKSAASFACLGEISTRAGRGTEWPVLLCADGFVALVYQSSDWSALCALVGDPRMQEPRFSTAAGRREHARDLADIIESMFRRHTRDELQRLALERRLPLGPVWDVAELRSDPQFLARDFLATVRLGDDGSVAMPRLPLLWNGEAFPVGVPPMAALEPDLEPAP